MWGKTTIYKTLQYITSCLFWARLRNIKTLYSLHMCMIIFRPFYHIPKWNNRNQIKSFIMLHHWNSLWEKNHTITIKHFRQIWQLGLPKDIVKHFALATKSEKAIFSMKVLVKVPRSLIMLTFERTSLVEYACQVRSFYPLGFKSYSQD